METSIFQYLPNIFSSFLNNPLRVLTLYCTMQSFNPLPDDKF